MHKGHKNSCKQRGELMFDPDEPKKDFCANCLGEISQDDDQLLIQAKFLDG